MMHDFVTVWAFTTARFAITLDIAPEDTDPAEQFEDEDDIAYAREGSWHWFTARVRVVFVDDTNPKNWAVIRNHVLGEAYLGCCSYRDERDFRSGMYFHDLVTEAVHEARGTVERLSDGIKTGRPAVRSEKIGRST